MRKFQNLIAFSALAVAAVLFAGCGNTDGGSSDDGGTESTATSDEGGGSPDGSDTSSVGTSGEFHLVSLNVPNMTWGGCKRSVRDALAKIDDIDEESIDTSKTLQVSFKAKSGFDPNKGLAVFEDHDHLKGWTVVE